MSRGLINSGFEVVTELPTTDLFEGREVMYNGKKYVYSSGWKEEITSNTMYEANLLWGGRNISNGYSPIDGAMMSELSANVMAFPNPTGISVEYSRDGGVSWLDYEATDEQKVNLFTSRTKLYCGKGGTANLPLQLRITITPMECGLYTKLDKIIVLSSNEGIRNCMCTLKGLTGTNVDAGNEDDSFYETIVDRAKLSGTSGYNVLNFDAIHTRPSNIMYPSFYHRLRLIFEYEVEEGSTRQPLILFSLRFFRNGRWTLPSNLATNNHLYSYDWQKNAKFPAKVESKEIINFDVNNIEPTQTGSSVSKTSTWLWQYLVQGINWLKANKFSGSYNDLTDKPTLATVATSGSYNDLTDKPTFSGSYNDLTDKPTLFSGSYEDLTNKPNLATVATSGNYEDLTNTPNLATVATSGSYEDLTDKPTLFSGSYNDLTNKPSLATVATSGSYNDLTDKPTLATVATSGSYDDLLNKPALVFSNIGGTISSAQIPDGLIANGKLANSSMTLNGTTVNLGDTATLPCYISVGGTLYHARIENNWLQIYRNGIWANLYYLLAHQPTVCHYITDLSDPSWYDDSVTEYELDNSATEQLLRVDSPVNLADLLEAIGAHQITFNSSVIPSKQFNKGALDNIINNLKGKGYSVFVENDIDTILGSGNDWFMSIKIKKVGNPYKAIIECYVAR